MTTLSADDTSQANEGALRRLLDLNDEIMEMGEGYWVTIRVTEVEPCDKRPHGIDYSLCLLSPDDSCLLRYDNAHPVADGKGVSATNDHLHKGKKVQVYNYSDAEKLMADFWTDVDAILKEKGVQ